MELTFGMKQLVLGRPIIFHDIGNTDICSAAEVRDIVRLRHILGIKEKEKRILI